ncbi:MAG: hypothetical protein ACI4ES_08145 [Roseburia sp.]
MSTDNMQTLFMELQSYENQGITIWLEGFLSTPMHVTSKLSLNEENLYMRDYIFDEGVLKEVRFDKINHI